MKKFMFVNFDRYLVAESTTMVIKSEKSLLEVFKDVMGDQWETMEELVCVNGKQCGFDGEEESYLLIEL